MPLILPGNVASATAAAYEVANSCRFNDGDSAYISRTLGTPSNADRFTFSMWIKRGTNLGAEQPLFVAGSSSSQGDLIMFRADAKLEWQMYHGSTTMQYKTNREFRDVAAWYHLVFTYDSGNGTAGDRQRIYVNGVEETSFAISTDVALNTDSKFNSAVVHGIGYDTGLGLIGSVYFDGYMAEVVLCDGQAYAASDFGEFDSDSPTIWKPKDVSGLTFGTNGFYLDFEASDNLGNDANGGTDWAESNLAAVDQASDTPTNNFCTMNPLGGQTAATSNNSWSLAEGNMSFVSGNAYSQWITGTMSISAGKWYWELQPQGTFGTSDNVPYVGIIKTTEIGARQALTSTTSASNDTITMEANGDKVVLGTTSAGYGDTFTNDDKLMMAVDCDNGKVWWGVNGTWQKSGAVGDPANGTNANATFTAGTEFVPYCLGWSGDATPINYNFGGCPAFTVSSAAQDENGYGRFEFSPPDSFLSLCSKNLGSDGG